MFFAPAMIHPFASCYPNRTCPKTRKTRFTHAEDEKLKSLVAKYGDNDWSTIAKNMENRNVRQCRERWRNYMNPNLSKELWSEDEDKKLMERYNDIGPHWNMIKQSFPDRSINAVRNRIIRLLGQQVNRQKSIAAPASEARHVSVSVLGNMEVQPGDQRLSDNSDAKNQQEPKGNLIEPDADIFSNTLEEELEQIGMFRL